MPVKLIIHNIVTFRYVPFQRNKRFSIQRDGLVFARWAEYCENSGIPVSYLVYSLCNCVTIIYVTQSGLMYTQELTALDFKVYLCK